MALPQSGVELVAKNASAYISAIGNADSATEIFFNTLKTADLGGFDAELDKIVGSLKQIDRTADAAASGFAPIAPAAKTAADGLDRVPAAVDRMARESQSGITAFEQIVIGGLRRVGEAVVNVAADAALAVVDFVGDSISAAGDFESAVNNLGAVAGDALTEAGYSFEDLSDKALQLGQDTAFSASQALDAMTELVKGGVPVADVMGDATDATLNLAAAAKLDLAPAAEIVAKQLGVWGETGVTATQTADLLSQAANASTVGVEELALGLANAGGTAKTAGVSFEETVQTLALIAPAFDSSASAGTSFKTFLGRLIPTTKPATEAMADLGLYTDEAGSAFYDAKGNFVGMEEATRLLQDATKDLSEEQQLLALKTIFGDDAINTAAALANAGADGFNAMGAAMAGAGTAAEVAAQQNQGFNFAMDALKGSIETVQIRLGSLLLPALTNIVNEGITPLVNAINPVIDAFLDAGAGSLEFREALSGVSPVLVPIYDTVMLLIGVVSSWGDSTTETGATIQTAISTVASVVSSVLDGLSAFWTANGDTILASATSTWNTISTTVEGLITALSAVVTSTMEVLSGFWAQNGDEIMAFTATTWDTISAIIGTVFDIIIALFNNGVEAYQWLADMISTHSDTIQTVLTVAWTIIEVLITGVLGIIQGATEIALAAIEGGWQGAIDKIGELISGFVTDAEGAFQAIIDTVMGLGAAAANAGKAFIESLGQGILDGIDWLIDQAKAGLQELADLLPGSEPKDPTSPLRGLGKRGMAFTENFAVGIEAAMPQAQTQTREALDLLVPPLPMLDVSPRAPVIEVPQPQPHDMAAFPVSMPALPLIPTLPTFSLDPLLSAMDTWGAAIVAALDPLSMPSVAPPAMPVFASNTSYGNTTITIDARGATMSEAQFEGVVYKVLDRVAGRASAMQRMGG